MPVEKSACFQHDTTAYPSRLRVSKDQIINENNEAVVLHGVMAPDPKYLDNKNKFNKNYYEKIFSLGGNAIRIPVHPEYYVSDEYYLWRYLDPVVEWAGNNGFYVIIDWHCIGNPLTGKGQNTSEIKDDVAGESKKFWKLVSGHYKDVPNVIFEIYNEATDIDGEDWSVFAKELASVVRSENANQLIICGSPDYSHNLSWIDYYALDDDNTAYSAHLFPSHHNREEILSSYMDKYPVVVTEWGYSDDDVKLSQKYLHGSETSYGRPMAEFMNKNHIGWIGAWYDNEWEPAMLLSGTDKYTKWGSFVVDLLSEVG